MNAGSEYGVAVKVSRIAGVILGGLLGAAILCAGIPAQAAGADQDSLDLAGLAQLPTAVLSETRAGALPVFFNLHIKILATLTVSGTSKLNISSESGNQSQSFTVSSTTVTQTTKTVTGP
jgi:hypothetical protein